MFYSSYLSYYCTVLEKTKTFKCVSCYSGIPRDKYTVELVGIFEGEIFVWEVNFGQ